MEDKTNSDMPRVTGIGGIFFKCKDPKMMKQWYADHLGMNVDEYGTSFEWSKSAEPGAGGYTVWSPFAESTKYFEPSEKQFMINYRVNDLVGLLEKLKKDGVTVMDKIDEYDYGKFGWIVDPEGNKIELWEPVDEIYSKMAEGKTTK